MRDGKKVRQVVLRSFSCIAREEDFESTLKIANSILEELKSGPQEKLDLLTELVTGKRQSKTTPLVKTEDECGDSVFIKNLLNKNLINEGFGELFFVDIQLPQALPGRSSHWQ